MPARHLTPILPSRHGLFPYLTLALLCLALPYRTASAASCTFAPLDTGVGNWQSSTAYAVVDMVTDNCCRMGKTVKSDGWLSAQQAIDCTAAPKDTAADTADAPGTLTQLDYLQYNMDHGLMPIQAYPQRLSQIACAAFGTPDTGASQTFRFVSPAGGKVRLRITPDGTPAPEAALVLHLSNADTGTLVKRTQGRPPFELTALLPAAGNYQAVLSRATDADHPYVGGYCLDPDGELVAFTPQSDVGPVTYRDKPDAAPNQCAVAGDDPRNICRCLKWAKCPGTNGTLMDYCTRALSATFSMNLCQSFLTYTGGTYTCDCKPGDPTYLGRLSAKAIKVNKALKLITATINWGTGWGLGGQFNVDASPTDS